MQRFTRLFNALVNSEEEIVFLITWIIYLRAENYNADMNVLKSMG